MLNFVFKPLPSFSFFVGPRFTHITYPNHQGSTHMANALQMPLYSRVAHFSYLPGGPILQILTLKSQLGLPFTGNQAFYCCCCSVFFSVTISCKKQICADALPTGHFTDVHDGKFLSFLKEVIQTSSLSCGIQNCMVQVAEKDLEIVQFGYPFLVMRNLRRQMIHKTPLTSGSPRQQKQPHDPESPGFSEPTDSNFRTHFNNRSLGSQTFSRVKMYIKVG